MATVENNGSETSFPIGRAAGEDVDALIELLRLRPSAFWMRRKTDGELRLFLTHALDDPRCVLLVARPNGGGRPAGYVLATSDTNRFWLGFALRNPALALTISVARLARLRERGKEIERRSVGGDQAAAVPGFSWTASGPANARIMGLYVRAEHRRNGIAMGLYFELFSALKTKGIARVEEYMGPDYLEYAGKFPQTCGWELQRCRCSGYKISKIL